MIEKQESIAMILFALVIAVGLGSIAGFIGGRCSARQDIPQEIKQERLENLGIVKVNYYTNLRSMTDDSPDTTAWNEPVREGIIAVSLDLLDVVQHNDCVFLDVDSMRKAFVVDDKMHPRHKRTVDIFMKVDFYKDCKNMKFNREDFINNIGDYKAKKELVYMPQDKVWITKADWQKLNTHFYSRMLVKL